MPNKQNICPSVQQPICWDFWILCESFISPCV